MSAVGQIVWGEFLNLLYLILFYFQSIKDGPITQNVTRNAKNYSSMLRLLKTFEWQCV